MIARTQRKDAKAAFQMNVKRCRSCGRMDAKYVEHTFTAKLFGSANYFDSYQSSTTVKLRVIARLGRLSRTLDSEPHRFAPEVYRVRFSRRIEVEVHTTMAPGITAIACIRICEGRSPSPGLRPRGQQMFQTTGRPASPNSYPLVTVPVQTRLQACPCG